ncbi:MAG TPA: NAD-binding protein [Anaerolineales bacterium]|nr:NAD-binding protein [Anaerolineales bacterium]HNB36474.1 NAD-binding protein [Anaerolineales bacterium]
MKQPTFKQRFQYWFDNYMSRGTIALIGGLAVLSLVIIFIAAAIIRVGAIAMDGESAPSFGEAAWMSLMRTLDAGTMGGDTGPGFRIVMLLVTIGGIFIVSTLIGILSNGLEERIEELRKGRSLVLESGHTLILGWTPQIFTIISELVAANESRKSGAVIVILADQDKVEMEDAINERIDDPKNTRIICRSGSPMDMNDLEIVSPHSARSIIVLSEGGDPDTHVIKTVLAITNNPNRRSEPYHIVTQIRDPQNMDVIKLLSDKDIVQPILTTDLIARVVAQTSRQSGLSIVYTELMNFGGDEIYFKQEPALSGKTYGEALHAYETSTVMGIRRADGTIMMSPSMDTRIESGDSIFAIAEDDDKIQLANLARLPLEENLIQRSGNVTKPKPERGLILGWNRSGTTIVRELDNYVAKGSELVIVSQVYDLEKQIQREVGKLKNQKLKVMEGDIRDRSLLDSLGATEYDHVIVLAYSHLDAQEADAITLVTLLHLRDIAEKDETPFSIISEMLDLRNRELAEAAKVDDFIVSEHLVSLMLAQLSENADLLGVFTDMFDPEGAEVYLKPIGDYVATDQPVNFYTITEAARLRGETAIGYRIMSESHDAEKAYGVHTNPKKSERVAFKPEDKLIVIAEG